MNLILIILSVNTTSYLKEEDKSFIIYQIVQSQDQYPTKNKNWLVSRKVSKGKKLPILHSSMTGILINLAEVYTSLLSHMNVNKC